ncbi:MAG: glutathione peroxidase [Clostridia bacterium]|nr:glutathione peroxidase [Clostridia bacterium]
MASVYDYKVMDAKGNEVDLADYKGKTLLIVNVASKCGYTYQYEGLEKLYKKYEDQGFVILGFPSNQFKGQEPGTDDEIQNFCKVNYGVSFPVLSKVDVLGESKIPLYAYLTEADPAEWIDVPEDAGHYGFFREFHGGDWGREIVWNFNKFLIDKEGNLVGRYASTTDPEALDEKVAAIL